MAIQDLQHDIPKAIEAIEATAMGWSGSRDPLHPIVICTCQLTR